METKQIDFIMGTLKALNVGGLHVFFFETEWEIVRKLVCEEVKVGDC